MPMQTTERDQTLFGGTHIPHDFRTWSFESYQRLPLADTQRQAALFLQAFMQPRLDQSYRGRKRGVYLYGSWGVGKTGLALSALQMALQAGYSGLYLPTIELFNILYESIAASQRLMRGSGDETDREEESAGAKLLRLVEQVEWLVLDDLGVECASRFVISRLYRIIEGRRCEPGRSTIFTSNKDARGLERHWRPERPGSPAFDDCERVIQRIGEYCTPIHLTGQSLREKRGNTHSS
jgi:DNA replication protein DnaC